MKRPSFQFYPGDWLNHAALRMCSIAARGLWIEMICLMHQGSPYGFLKVNHRAILPENLARIAGITIEEVHALLGELEGAGVFSRDADGCIFSPRMVRDEEVRAKRAAGGHLGGNPALVKRDGKVAGKVNLVPTPSSSSSSSSSTGSAPIGTGGLAAKPASELTTDELWSVGKSLLQEAGMPKVQSGSFVGKLVKDHGQPIVLDAVRAAVVARPADPAEYLKAACMRAARQRPRRSTSHVDLASQDFREGCR
jgi:hypothetical protein